MMVFELKTRNCVSKTRNCSLKMLNFADNRDVDQVSFQWKNPDFLFRNPDFLLKKLIL